MNSFFYFFLILTKGTIIINHVDKCLLNCMYSFTRNNILNNCIDKCDHKCWTEHITKEEILDVEE